VIPLPTPVNYRRREHFGFLRRIVSASHLSVGGVHN